jgi:hypothetical protein
MQVGASLSFLWYLTMLLDVVLAALLLRRRAFRSFPFFTIFIFVSIARSFALWSVYRVSGFSSRQAFKVYWITQIILLVARGAVCAELCRYVLRRYSKRFWFIARNILLTIAAGIILYAALDSLHVLFRVSSLIVAAERGLELSIALVLVALLLVALRYPIVIPRTPFLLVIGLCFYSLVQTLNNTLIHWLSGQFPAWNNFRIIAFQASLLLWILAFMGRDSDSEDKPIDIVSEAYPKYEKEISQRLRALDGDLEEITRG